MFENERKYFVENVIPSYKEYFDHRESNEWGENQLLRKGMNAANALFHFREQLPEAIRPSKHDLKNESPDFGLLADIANAAKHKIIHRDSPRISNASQIYEVLLSTIFRDEQGEYFYPQLDVFAMLDDGNEINFSELIQNVMSMWQDKLRTWGIVDLKPFCQIEFNRIISRSEAEKRRTDGQMTRGEGYSWKFRQQKYNYEKNVIEPIYLSESKMQLVIKKIPTSIPISISIPNTQFDFDFDLPLTAEQAQEYLQLPTEDMKASYLDGIIENNIELKRNIQSEIIKNMRENEDKPHP